MIGGDRMCTPDYLRMVFAASLIMSGASFAQDIDGHIIDMGSYSALPAVDLESSRGMGGVSGLLQLNNMNQDATLEDNQIQSSVSGSNSISNGAFSDLGGFATVIQNSGNHVIIQNATIVNLTVGD